uniref:DEK_C domain-containing protein n=1 Tax=Angiostrongylus cantonensis TaxID=6313 RepID=A0A0K0DK00_ANGCA
MEELTKEQTHITSTKNKDERSEKKDNVYNLMRTLNLTDEETKDIVKRVEKFLDFDLHQIVRDELVKKLSEVRLTGHTNPPDVSQKSSTLVPTTDATTQATTTEEERKTDDHTTSPMRQSTSEKELLSLLPKKNGHSENKSNFVEAEIFTAQLHLPIEEKMVDEKNYDDLPISNEERMTMELDGAFPVSLLIFVGEVYSIATVIFDHTEVFECLEHLKDQEYEMSGTSTPSTVQLATDIAAPQASTPSETLPTTQIHEVVSNTINNTKKVIIKSRNGIDANALNMKFVTGAPLDLDNEDNHALAYRNRNLHRSASSTNPPAPTFPKSTSGKPRHFTHPKTPFERLVVDYKQRLAGGMDIDKILKSIYSNAYISLIDAKDAPKVQIPLSMRRAEITLG